jgi:hypothetical protein
MKTDADNEGRTSTLGEDESAATALEWTLLLAAIAIPSYFIIKLALAALIGHYQLITSINALPFP